MFSKVKKNLADKFSNEKLGAVDEQEEVVEETKKLPRKKAKSPQEITIEDVIQASKDDEALSKGKSKGNSKGVHNILKMLSIDEKVDTSSLLTQEMLKSIEFTLETPIGFSQDEVIDFTMRMISQLGEFEKLLSARDRDVMRLAEELDSVQISMNDMKNNMQMESMLDDSEDELNELKLKLSNEIAKRNMIEKELNSIKSTSNSSDDINILKVENDTLRESIREIRKVNGDQARELNKLQGQVPKDKARLSKPSGLPGFIKPKKSLVELDSYEGDSFEEMLLDIEGGD